MRDKLSEVGMNVISIGYSTIDDFLGGIVLRVIANKTSNIESTPKEQCPGM